RAAGRTLLARLSADCLLNQWPKPPLRRPPAPPAPPPTPATPATPALNFPPSPPSRPTPPNRAARPIRGSPALPRVGPPAPRQPRQPRRRTAPRVSLPGQLRQSATQVLFATREPFRVLARRHAAARQQIEHLPCP